MFASSELPTIDTPMPNFVRVWIGDITVWFSYRTPIAIHVNGQSRIVRRNDWGPTTGKHLNAIDGGNKDSRVDTETFHAKWKEAIGGGAAIAS